MGVNKQYKILFKRYIVLTLNRQRDYIYIYRLKLFNYPQTGKNHEFRKYHCQLAVEHYVSKGWEREKAEKYVIQRHLSHSSERQDLKKIYLYS